MVNNRNNDSISIIQDHLALSDHENKLVEEFHKLCEKHAQSRGVDPTSDGYDIHQIAEKLNILLYEYHKEGIFVQALWVTYLQIMKKYLRHDATALKYQNIEQFHDAYHGIYQESDALEQERLWETANWMAVLFNLIPARKNKGLAMQIIPKLVEGWHAKYVTGSGQTKATADRVHVFEVEGDITINHRGGRMKPKKHAYHPPVSTESSTPTTRRRVIHKAMPEAPSTLTKRRRTGEAIKPSSIPLVIYENPINASKYMSHLAHVRAANDDHASENTDNDEDSDNEDTMSSSDIKKELTKKEPAHMSKSQSFKTSTQFPAPSSQSVITSNKDREHDFGGFQLFRSSSLEMDASSIPSIASLPLQRNISISQRLGAPGVVNDQFLRTFDYLDNVYPAQVNGKVATALNQDDLFSGMEWFELLAICQ